MFGTLLFSVQPVELLLVSIGENHEIHVIALCTLWFVGYASIFIGWNLLPSIEDFFWMDRIFAVYVVDLKSQSVLYSEFLKNEGEMNDNESRFLHTEFIDLFIGGMTGIQSQVSDVMELKRGEGGLFKVGRFEIVSLKDEKLIFFIITSGYVPIMKQKLRLFKNWFKLYFGSFIDRNIFDREKYEPTKNIISMYFKPTMEER